MRTKGMKQLRIVFCVFLMFAFLFMTGFASIFKGTKQTLTFNSEPDGAQVIIDGKPLGVTPLSISLKKNKFDVVMIQKEGYRTQTMPLDKKFDGIAIFNILWDLSTTDLITGAIYEYSPNQYHFVLKKKDAD